MNDILDSELDTFLGNVMDNAVKTDALLTELNIDDFPSFFAFKYIRYREKYVTPVVDMILNHDDAIDRSVIWYNLAKSIATDNDEKWSRLLGAYYKEYDILGEKSMHETYEGSSETTGSESSSHREQTNSESKVSNSFYGFNSAEAVPVSDTDSTGEVVSAGGKSDNEKEHGEESSKDYEITREGHDISPQELIMKELQLRRTQIMEVIYTDIAHYVCLEIY